MNPEEKAELDALCQRLIAEEDQNTFLELVQQLNLLLERKEDSLERNPDLKAS